MASQLNSEDGYDCEKVEVNSEKFLFKFTKRKPSSGSTEGTEEAATPYHLMENAEQGNGDSLLDLNRKKKSQTDKGMNLDHTLHNIKGGRVNKRKKSNPVRRKGVNSAKTILKVPVLKTNDDDELDSDDERLEDGEEDGGSDSQFTFASIKQEMIEEESTSMSAPCDDVDDDDDDDDDTPESYTYLFDVGPDFNTAEGNQPYNTEGMTDNVSVKTEPIEESDTTDSPSMYHHTGADRESHMAYEGEGPVAGTSSSYTYNHDQQSAEAEGISAPALANGALEEDVWNGNSEKSSEVGQNDLLPYLYMKEQIIKGIEAFDTENQSDETANDKKHRCQYCGKRFIKKYLEVHISRVHKGERPFHCHLCNWKFGMKAHLTRHLESHEKNTVHPCRTSKSDRTEYRCGVCDKVYYENRYLVRHMLVHKNERPHKCTECDKSYRYRNSLTRHQLKHSGGPKIECGVCNRKFYDSHGLNKHLVSHTGVVNSKLQCEVCYRPYQTFAGLNSHLLRIHPTHDHKQKMECDYCKKEFIPSKDFERHIKLHRDKMSNFLFCKICGKGYPSKSVFKTHILMSHGNKKKKIKRIELNYNDYILPAAD